MGGKPPTGGHVHAVTHRGPVSRILAGAGVADGAMSYEIPSERENDTIFLVGLLRATADTTPLVSLLRGADGGPERARDALSLLAELDRELLVQVALDALIDGNFADPALAEQTRRVVRRRTGFL